MTDKRLKDLALYLLEEVAEGTDWDYVKEVLLDGFGLTKEEAKELDVEWVFEEYV